MVLKIKLYKEKQYRDADAQLFTLQQLVGFAENEFMQRG
jgi:hypothetical protein